MLKKGREHRENIAALKFYDIVGKYKAYSAAIEWHSGARDFKVDVMVSKTTA